MPKVYMKYTCGVCGKPYDHKRSAAGCARSHIVPVRIYQPLFRRSSNVLIGAWILFSDGQVCFYSSAKTPNEAKLAMSRLSDYILRSMNEIKETEIETPVFECVLCRALYPSEEKALECEENHPEVANIQSLTYFSEFDLTDDAIPDVAPRNIVVNYKIIGNVNQVTTLRYHGFNFDELIGFPDGVDEAGFLVADDLPVTYYQCIKGFLLNDCDGDGFLMEKLVDIEAGSLWKTAGHKDDARCIFGGDIRLYKVDVDPDQEVTWLELSHADLAKYFKEEVADASNN